VVDIMALYRKATALLVCDIQDRFRGAIYKFGAMSATSARMVRFAKLFETPVFVTEQNPRALGTTAPELGIDKLGSLHVGTWPKTTFSMYIPEIKEGLRERHIKDVMVVGLESHVCVYQTALDLLADGFRVHAVADAISSCNPEEIPIALAGLRQAGVNVTTSECLAFRLMGDAGKPDFKEFTGILKEERAAISTSLRELLAGGGETQEIKSSL